MISERVDGKDENSLEYEAVDKGTSKIRTNGNDMLETVLLRSKLELRTAICLLDLVSNKSTFGIPGPLQFST